MIRQFSSKYTYFLLSFIIVYSCSNDKEQITTCMNTATLNEIEFCMPYLYSHTLIAKVDSDEVKDKVVEIQGEDEAILATYVDNRSIRNDGNIGRSPNQIIIISLPRQTVSFSTIDLQNLSKEKIANVITPKQLYEDNRKSNNIINDYHWGTSQELLVNENSSQTNCWSYLTIDREYPNYTSNQSNFVLKIVSHISFNNFHFKITAYSNYYGDHSIKDIKKINDEFVLNFFESNPEILKISSIELKEISYNDQDNVANNENFQTLLEFIRWNKNRGRRDDIGAIKIPEILPPPKK